MIAAASRLSAARRQVSRGLRHLCEGGEQAIMTNRLALAGIVYLAAAIQACSGDKPAGDFYRTGLPWLQIYLAATAAIQAHIMLRPGPCVLRRILAISCDAAVISLGLCQGDGGAAYLFPLYFWMILGNGVRLGGKFMGAAVASSALGFAATFWFSPFWRDHSALSTGLFLSIVIIPVYGARLLRRAAEARAEAERANHAKTLLLASVSHELRTPLTAVVGLADLLQKTQLDGEQREMVQTLGGAVGILMRHIEALLIVSREEMEPREIVRERVDLFALLTSLRALLAVEADKKGVRLGLCIEAETPRHVMADPGLLLDILQNLGGNAVKFTSAGAVVLRVGVRRRAEESLDLRVEVRDTGIGVDKAAQSRIFDCFVQADPEISRRFGGSGLGLAIARRRLEACGGRIGVESEFGKGALFWFELTVGAAEPAASVRPAPASLDEAPPSLAELENVAEGPQFGEPICAVATEGFDALALARRFAVLAVARDGDPESFARAKDVAARLRELAAGGASEPPRESIGPRKILLAEDNGVNRMVLNKILTNAGHETTQAADGEAALQAMLNDRFDLILLDVNMPGMSGVEAARLYRLSRPSAERAPMIGLTADASPGCREQCARAGMVACLAKPIAPEALLATVAAAAQQVEKTLEPLKPAKGKAPLEASDGGLDRAALDALTGLGGDEFLRDLILQFVEEGGQIVERMIGAVKNGDRVGFEREAHALSSSAGNLGAAELARLCRSWRDLGIAWRGDDYLEDLRREWSFAALALGKILAERQVEERSPGASRKRKPRQRRGDVAA